MIHQKKWIEFAGANPAHSKYIQQQLYWIIFITPKLTIHVLGKSALTGKSRSKSWTKTMLPRGSFI
jgi:hypothetical protein